MVKCSPNENQLIVPEKEKVDSAQAKMTDDHHPY
jgi:hypothetical protein